MKSVNSDKFIMLKATYSVWKRRHFHFHITLPDGKKRTSIFFSSKPEFIAYCGTRENRKIVHKISSQWRVSFLTSFHEGGGIFPIQRVNLPQRNGIPFPSSVIFSSPHVFSAGRVSRYLADVSVYQKSFAPLFFCDLFLWKRVLSWTNLRFWTTFSFLTVCYFNIMANTSYLLHANDSNSFHGSFKYPVTTRVSNCLRACLNFKCVLIIETDSLIEIIHFPMH